MILMFNMQYKYLMLQMFCIYSQYICANVLEKSEITYNKINIYIYIYIYNENIFVDLHYRS